MTAGLSLFLAASIIPRMTAVPRGKGTQGNIDLPSFTTVAVHVSNSTQLFNLTHLISSYLHGLFRGKYSGQSKQPYRAISRSCLLHSSSTCLNGIVGVKSPEEKTNCTYHLHCSTQCSADSESPEPNLNAIPSPHGSQRK
ncbi:hypothetical protein BDW75DRAFT_206527 [Aspergillus navahoensis]